VEIGLNVVVDRGRGSTTTNYEGLVMIVTCDTKQVNKVIGIELEVVQRPRKKRQLLLSRLRTVRFVLLRKLSGGRKPKDRNSILLILFIGSLKRWLGCR
jgi:hypothetical protein